MICSYLAFLASLAPAPQQTILHPESPSPIYNPEEWLGASVALDGPIAAVSAPGDVLFSAGAPISRGSVSIRSFDGTSWTEDVELYGDSLAPRFGSSLALQGDVLVVGAPRAAAPGFNPGLGYVKVYRSVAGTWVEEARLTPSNSQTNDGFAGGLALDGDRLAVTSTNYQINGDYVGGITIFERSAGSWNEVAFLEGTAQDRITSTVALEGDRFALGNFLDCTAAVYQEAAPGNWILEQRIQAPTSCSRFGERVLLENGELFIQDSSASVQIDGEWYGFCGRFHIYERSGSVWSESARVVPDHPSDDLNFASAMALDGSRLLVSAPGTDQIYRYARSGGGWISDGIFDAPAGGREGSMALAGDRVLFGRSAEDLTGEDSGAAYLHAFNGGSLDFETRFDPLSSELPLQGFGKEVELSGDHLAAVMGYALNTHRTPTTVQTYQRGPAGWSWTGEIERTFDPNGPGFGRFADSISLLGDRLLIGDSLGSANAPGAEDAGRVLAYEFDGSEWVGPQQILRNQANINSVPPHPGARFGAAIAADGPWVVVGAPGQYTPIGSPRGFAHIFNSNGTVQTYNYVTFLTADNSTSPQGQMGFGGAVDVGGGTIAVASVNRSRIDLFDRVSGIWTRTDVLWDQGTQLGQALSVDGDRLAASARSPLQVRIYERPGPGSPFELEHTLVPADTPIHAEFGSRLDLKGDTLLVGAASYEDDDPVGIAYIYRYTDGRWVESRRIDSPQGVPGDQFGAAVALDGNNVAIGASTGEGPDGTIAEGFVLIDEFESDRFNFCPCDGGSPCGNEGDGRGCWNASGVGGFISATGSTSIGLDDQVITAVDLPSNVSGLIYRGRRATGSIPFGNGLRCVSGQTRRGPVRNTGAGGTLTLGPGYATAENTVAPANVHILPGTTWYFQAYFRDVNGPCGHPVSMSNALAVTYAP